MLQELQAAPTDLPIEILGINSNTDAAYNGYVTASSGLPWLQDTIADHVWSNWRAAYRDVRILDVRNQVRTVFNLNTYDLSVSTNRQTLKALLREAARATDSDGDKLLDEWEEEYWGDLSAQPKEDPDNDGADNATEFAFGSHPRDPASRPPPLLLAKPPLGGQPLELRFRRRAGAWLSYTLEGCAVVQPWDVSPDWLTPAGIVLPQFDGTGTAWATLPITPPLTAAGQGFLRLRVVGPR
jgi:hypothetical protein